MSSLRFLPVAVTHLLLWAVLARPPSTSQERQHSKIWYFGLDRRKMGGVALQAITPKRGHPPRTSIHAPYTPTLSEAGPIARQSVGERGFGQLSNLDRFLVQLWGSHLVRSKIICTMPKGKKEEEYVRGTLSVCCWR